MATKAGVGFSENPRSREAGVEAALAATQQAGIESPRAATRQAGSAACDLVILFATSKHDPVLLSEGVRSVVGPKARLFGGSAVGIITAEHLGYEGFQVGVAVVQSDSLQVDMYIEGGLPDNEHNVGVKLGQQISSRHRTDDSNILLLYDLVKRQMSEGLSLNMATPLIAGMSEGLGTWPAAAGGGLTGDMQFHLSFQWFDDRIEHQSAMALVFGSEVQLDTAVMHGCKPSSDYHTITKAEGNVVLELDGQPSADVITEMLGPRSETSWEDYPLFITLGLNHGDKYGEATEDDYAVRLCMAVDRERRGLVMFGDDLTAGSEVQLMRRSINFDYIARRAESLLERARDRTPFLALYIDCAGRAGAYSGTETEEAEEVQRVIGSRIPLLGWYVGCEIAKTRSVMQSHNWTGILCILSE
jgi:hypothetical protein